MPSSTRQSYNVPSHTTGESTQYLSHSFCSSISCRSTSTTSSSNPFKSESRPEKKQRDYRDCHLSIMSKLSCIRSRYSRKNTLLSRGYKKTEIISVTLQGQIFIAEKTKSHRDSLLIYGYIRTFTNPVNISEICFNYIFPSEIVIKTADKSLYANNKVTMNEDIVSESELMQYFMANNPPLALIKYFDFFEDENNYFIVMERGSKHSLFDFVVSCHKHIQNGLLSLREWKKCVRFIFYKMVRVMDWMHNTVHCCNLDISLENIVMSKDTYFDECTGLIRNLDIRFIDFGLSQTFDLNSDFICDKFVGKIGYKSPQIFNLETFCANKSDVWSMGVCLFMLSIGAPPYNSPCKSDAAFEVLMNGEMRSVLKSWDRLKYIGKSEYDLLMKMLCVNENDRISISEIKNHQWIRAYFVNENELNDSIISENHNFCIDYQIKRKVRKSSIAIVESQTFEVGNVDICACMD